MSLRKGGNLPLPRSSVVTVSCAWVPNPPLDADLSALLLVGGKVRTDDDFVFYNQPASSDGSVEHLGKTSRPDGSALERITVDLDQVNPAVDSIAFVISLDGPVGTSLSDLRSISATLHTADGSTVTVFEVTDLVRETAAVTVELYRRDNWWKVRGVGQGYSDGLAGLARDFGVTVDDAAPVALPADRVDLLVAPLADRVDLLVAPLADRVDVPAADRDPARHAAADAAAPVGPPPIDWTRPPVPAGYEI